jgi:DNA-nicking Smr family endonuclease
MHAPDEELPLSLPIDGVLDLHTFRPQDVKEVVTDYLEACRQANVLEVRVIHGKGIGQLRRTVHALLAKLPCVRAFALAHPLYGGDGATMVHLRPCDPPPREPASS